MSRRSLRRKIRNAASVDAPAVWPDGVFARYQTLVGATVDLTKSGSLAEHRCTGCGHSSLSPRTESMVRQEAQTHAETCRALPKPDGAA